jgi:hypothetical protein
MAATWTNATGQAMTEADEQMASALLATRLAIGRLARGGAPTGRRPLDRRSPWPNRSGDSTAARVGVEPPTARGPTRRRP